MWWSKTKGYSFGCFIIPTMCINQVIQWGSNFSRYLYSQDIKLLIWQYFNINHKNGSMVNIFSFLLPPLVPPDLIHPSVSTVLTAVECKVSDVHQ